MYHNSYTQSESDFFTLYTAPLILEDSASRIPGEYVVVLKDGIEDEKGIYIIQ